MSDGNENDAGGAQVPPDRPDRRGEGGWSDRVTVVPGPAGFAYVPGELLTTDPGRTLEVARRLFPRLELRLVGDEEELELRATPARRLQGVPDVPRVVRELRAAGAPAQPNHVFFAHCADGCCCGPHPATRGCGGASASPVASPVYASPVYASPVYASPVYASPVYASPVYASPVYASPVYASPVYASPVYASPAEARTGLRRSSARPPTDGVATAAALAKLAVAATTKSEGGPHVVVLDTGLPEATAPHFPGPLAGLGMVSHAAGPFDIPDTDGDLLLDPCAGHGSFIAGVIEQVAPGAVVESRAVIGPLGDATESAIAGAIHALDTPGGQGAVLNLSFGGPVMTEPGVLASAVADAQDRGYVVVASAGNDGTCRPTYPAAFPDVVGVGAIGPHGPALFTNYGPWVRACAPGVDLVSTFFAFNGDEVAPGTQDPDPDDFDGWAIWSGSSFSAPVVAGALVNHMRTHDVSAKDAVVRVIDDPALLRLADLGTVINLA
jgi:hypothetical protein